MQHFDTLFIHANIATMHRDYGFGIDNPYGSIKNAALGILHKKITFLGSMDTLTEYSADTVIDCQNKWITPALIDCHTHLVYGGNRSNEFEMRLNGVEYSQIAQNGGGILSTVRATRQMDFDTLYNQSAKRLQDFINQGVGAIEIKSGYGLNLADERKMLQVAKALGEHFNIHVQKTYLAAHALPIEYQNKKDEYINQVCQWMRILHSENLIDAVDAFCEHIAFDIQQVRAVFDTAKQLNLPVKLHAEQLSNMQGAALVADFDGLSADHIEYLSEENIIKMAQKNVAGILLPTAFYCLKEKQMPPIDLMRAHGIKMAVSTDCNPGTSPSTSLLLAMNMACTLFGLTPEESLAGVTTHAACALGIQKTHGTIAQNMPAHLALWDIDRPADLCYLIGQNRLVGSFL